MVKRRKLLTPCYLAAVPVLQESRDKAKSLGFSPRCARSSWSWDWVPEQEGAALFLAALNGQEGWTLEVSTYNHDILLMKKWLLDESAAFLPLAFPLSHHCPSS